MEWTTPATTELGIRGLHRSRYCSATLNYNREAYLARIIADISAAIADSEVRIQCGTLSSRHDQVMGARPRKRGGDAPGCGRPSVQPGGLAVRSLDILCQSMSPSLAGSALEPASLILTRGPSPLVESPRRGHPPSELPGGMVPRLAAPRACLAPPHPPHTMGERRQTRHE